MIKGIIFDMDGTLTKPNMDFGTLAAEIGEAMDEPVLEYMEKVDEKERVRVNSILERFEAQAAENAELNDGARALLDFVVRKGKKTALLTRNSRTSADKVLSKHNLKFDCIVSREDAKPKPSPDPILLIGRKLGIKPEHLLVVGDYKFDVLCGKAAGAKTVLLLNHKEFDSGVVPDFKITRLTDLITILEDIG
ncbi:MAG: HAD family hydrolase [Planctomycetes bacterium]|nr:HAD family hydrolase [Planctomycetota bacterium]